MAVLIESHDVAVERPTSTTDDTGWVTGATRTQVWAGRGQVKPGQVADRAAAAGGGGGPFDPATTGGVVVVLPQDAMCAPGDVLVIDGQDYAVGAVLDRPGPVPALSHLRVEAVTV